MSSEKEQEVKFLIEETREVLNALDIFSSVADGSSVISDLGDYMGDIRHSLMSKGVMSIDWSVFYRGMGRTAMNTLGKFKQEKFARFLVEKHQKYGIKPLLNWKHIGIVVRIDAKIERFMNQKEAGMKDDEDQVMDILGYCVLGFYLNAYLMAMAKHATQKITIAQPSDVSGTAAQIKQVESKIKKGN